ncbi:hypothetical protein Tco_0508966 [Tanacetum coccineum]
MLEKHLYDSWKSRMELYMMNRPHGRMILASVEKGPLVWPSITEDGVTRLKEYVELTPAEAIQADCDIKAINIILQGLPTEIYALVSQHRVAKDLWEKIKLLMQGTSLTKQERECKLYDEFDKFTYKKGETLHEYYLLAFLNTLPDEWSKFVTDVKLVKDLHTTNVDQLHAHLQQHERHAIEVRLMHERNPDPLALVASHQLTQPAYQTHLHPHQQSLPQQHISPYQSSQFLTPYQHHQYSTPLSSTYPTNEYQSTVHHNVYSQQPSIPQLEYAPTTYQQQQPEFSQPDSSLVVPVFQKGDDPIDAINHMMSFLTAVVTSRYPTTNNQLRTSSNPRQQATIYDGKGRCKPGGHIAKQCTKPKRKRDETWFNDKVLLVQAQAGGQALTEEEIAFLADPGLPDLNSAKIALMPILSRMDQDALTEVVKERTTATAITEGTWGGEIVPECQKCLELETELVKKKDFVDKETYDKLCKCFTNLEKHCITLEADSQLNQEIFQQENSVLNQNAPSFSQLFELSELKAQSQAKDTVIVKLKEQIKSLKGNGEDSSVKLDMDEIETLNIELEHRVTKLVTENEHLKQTYKQLYDSIKPKRVQSKEQCDALIKQVNIKSAEISDLNAKLQEQGLVIAALKNDLRKLKGKALDNKESVTHSVDPIMDKDNMEPITPKLLNKRTAHSSYIKHTQEEALVLRDIVEHVKANYPHDPLLESAVRYTKVIQDLLSHISRSCPSINNCGPQKTEAIPRKKDKQVRFAETLTLTENTKPASTSNIVANKRVLHSTGVRHSTCASGSQPSGNTKNDRIPQPPSSNLKNKVEAHHRNVKTSLNKKNGAVNVKGSAVVQNLKKQDNSDSICVSSNDCMSSDNLCVSNAVFECREISC